MLATFYFLIVTTCLVGSSLGACTKDHPRVGLTGELSTLQHDVEGTVEVVDDCTFKVLNFKYDGTGPDVFWYAADTVSSLASGYIMNSIPRSKGAWDGSEEVVITLPEGATWDNINVISVWCRQFGIDFGSAVIPNAPDSQPEKDPEEDPLKKEKKVNLTAEETEKVVSEKKTSPKVDKETVGSLSGGSFGSFSGSSTGSVASGATTSVSSGSTTKSSFAGGSTGVQTRGSASAQSGGSTALKQKETPSDEFAMDQVENENGSAKAKMPLFFLLGSLVIGLLFGAA